MPAGGRSGLPIQPRCGFEILKFGINPGDAVWDARHRAHVSIALRHFQRLAEHVQRFRNPSLVSQGHAKLERSDGEEEPVTKARRKLDGFPREPLGLPILTLKEVHESAEE